MNETCALFKYTISIQEGVNELSLYFYQRFYCWNFVPPIKKTILLLFCVGLWLCLCSTLEFQHWHPLSPTRCFALTVPLVAFCRFSDCKQRKGNSIILVDISVVLLSNRHYYRTKNHRNGKWNVSLVKIRHFLSSSLLYLTRQHKIRNWIDNWIQRPIPYTRGKKNHNNQIKWIRTIRELADSRHGKYRDIGKYTYLLCARAFSVVDADTQNKTDFYLLLFCSFKLFNLNVLGHFFAYTFHRLFCLLVSSDK